MTKIVSIHSFRGGTGKSNLTANLAATLARQGQCVAIVDTDIQSPGIHVLFKLDVEQMDHTLNDYLWGRCTAKEAACDVSDTLKTEEMGNDGRLYLIPSSIKATEIARVLREGYDVGRLNDGFEELIRCLNLDYLLIDTHPGLSEETLLSITISDVLVIILRPDSQDFQGTAVAVEVARKLEVTKLLLVVNKAVSTLDYNDLQTQVETTYNAPVAGIVPFSEEVMQLGSNGLFCLSYADHPFSNTVLKIAQQIVDS